MPQSAQVLLQWSHFADWLTKFDPRLQMTAQYVPILQKRSLVTMCIQYSTRRTCSPGTLSGHGKIRIPRSKEVSLQDFQRWLPGCSGKQ